MCKNYEENGMAYSPASFGYTDDEWERQITATDERLTELLMMG